MDQSVNATVDRRRTVSDGASLWADFFFDAFYGGAIGGSTVALVVLIIDAIKFEPLFTPSLLGSALVLGLDPETVSGVRMDMVAFFTALHLVVFLVLGLLVSAMVQRMHDLALHPGLVSLIIFLVLQGGFVLADTLFMQGVVAVIGFWWIAIANGLTGLAMGIFLMNAHSTPTPTSTSSSSRV